MPKTPVPRSSSSEVQQFLKKSRDITRFVGQQPRLIFAIDATASRQPTWDTACQLQRSMFDASAAIAQLSVQLCYYRGFNEFHAGQWLSDPGSLGSAMGRVYCVGGHTQIARLLRHALAENKSGTVRALVFIGDAIEENPDTLCNLAGQCGMVGMPLFLFQEGSSVDVEQTLKTMARLSKGAWARFDQSSADALSKLLGAVGRYAAGGRKALENSSDSGDKLLLQQLK